MIPTGPRVERETSITWDEETKDLRIWTASGVTYRKLLKLGHKPLKDEARTAVFVLPARCLTLRKAEKRRQNPHSMRSPGRKEVL